MIMILRVDPETQTASFLSLPRDRWVPISPRRRNAKHQLGAAGGRTRANVIETIKHDFAISINHYAQVNFYGFKTLVAARRRRSHLLQHVPARDLNDGAVPRPDPGCIISTATEALAYARSRHLHVHGGQSLEERSHQRLRSHRPPAGVHQAVAQRAIDKGVRNPASVLNSLIGVAQRNVSLDDKITTQDLLNLGSEFRNFDPETAQELHSRPPPAPSRRRRRAPTRPRRRRRADLRPLPRPGRADNPLRAIQVEVRNGSGRSSQAQEVLTGLDGLGFTAIGSSDSGSFRNQHTQVRYAPGAEAAASSWPATSTDAAVHRDRTLPGHQSWCCPPARTSPRCAPIRARPRTSRRSSPRPRPPPLHPWATAHHAAPPTTDSAGIVPTSRPTARSAAGQPGRAVLARLCWLTT